MLIEEYEQLANHPLSTTRRNSSSRAAHEAELDDIFGLVDSLISSDTRQTVCFDAANLDRVCRVHVSDFYTVIALEDCNRKYLKLDIDVNKVSSAVTDLYRNTSVHRGENDSWNLNNFISDVVPCKIKR